MADIVLKDRNGNDVQYPGVNYINVNTVDGGTQGFAAYDPETLTPENLPVGVKVGDVEGALDVPEMLEDMPIALDFSDGSDMEITAPDGYAVKSAVVQKPANLEPGNIAKDVDIAGVVGTLEAGGGGGGAAVPCTFTHSSAEALRTGSGLKQVDFSYTLPPGSVILTMLVGQSSDAASGSTSTKSTAAKPEPAQSAYVFSTNSTESGIAITASPKTSNSSSYTVRLATFLVSFSVPGYFITPIAGGEHGVYATADAPNLPADAFCMASHITEIDLSASSISTLTTAFAHFPSLRKVVFPSTITSLHGAAFNYCDSLEELDFSRCTAVPTLTGAILYFGTFLDTLQVKVPAALYDEWITTFGWANRADRIVAV